MRRLLLPILMLLASPALAGEAIAVCHVGGPGSTRQAQPSLDRFLRHLESVAGLTANSLRGEYHTRADRCAEYVDREDPALAVFDLATWLGRSDDWGLAPIGHFGAPKAERYHLVVRQGSFHDLESLRGATLTSVYVGDNDFTSRIVFGNRVDVSEHFDAQRVKQPLRSVRQVKRGQRDAALVDHFTREHLSEIDPEGELKVLFSSEGLPGLTLGQVEGRAGEVVRRVAQALPKVCAGAGSELCEVLQVKALVAANGTLMSRLQRRYDAGRAHMGSRVAPTRGSQPLGPGQNRTSRQVGNDRP
jgi:hypothetical protein